MEEVSIWRCYLRHNNISDGGWVSGNSVTQNGQAIPLQIVQGRERSGCYDSESEEEGEKSGLFSKEGFGLSTLGFPEEEEQDSESEEEGEKWVFFPKRVLVYPLLGTLKNKKKKNKTAASADSSATGSDQLTLEHPPLDAASSALSALNALNSGDPNWVGFFNPAQEFDWVDFSARFGQDWDTGSFCVHPPGLKLRLYKWGL